MANRKAIVDEIRHRYGDSLTSKQVLAYLGVDYKTGKKFLRGLDSFTVSEGGHSRYLAIDVAAAIDRRQTKAPTGAI